MWTSIKPCLNKCCEHSRNSVATYPGPLQHCSTAAPTWYWSGTSPPHTASPQSPMRPPQRIMGTKVTLLAGAGKQRCLHTTRGGTCPRPRHPPVWARGHGARVVVVAPPGRGVLRVGHGQVVVVPAGNMRHGEVVMVNTLELETNIREDWSFTIMERATATSFFLKPPFPYDFHFCIGTPISRLLTVGSCPFSIVS